MATLCYKRTVQLPFLLLYWTCESWLWEKQRYVLELTQRVCNPLELHPCPARHWHHSYCNYTLRNPFHCSIYQQLCDGRKHGKIREFYQPKAVNARSLLLNGFLVQKHCGSK